MNLLLRILFGILYLLCNSTGCSQNQWNRLENITVSISKVKSNTNTLFRTKICCSDFELVKFACVPCKIGYTSTGGKSCTVCPENFYGKHCANDCKCDQDQRCDNVMGCVNITKPTILPTVFSTEITPVVTYNDLITIINEDKNKDITTKKREEFQLSEREQIFYSVSIGCCFVLLCSCFIFIKYKQKRYYKRRLQIALQAIQNESNSRRNETISRNEGAYALIDESNMIDINLPNPNLYLDVIHSSATSSVSDNVRSIYSGYLNPYQPLSRINMQSHNEDNSNTWQGCDAKEDSTSSYYANLYQMLTTKLKDTTDDYQKIVHSPGFPKMEVVPEKRRHSLHDPYVHQYTQATQRTCSI